MPVQNGNCRLTRNLVLKSLPPVQKGSIREGFPNVDRWSSFYRFLDRCRLNPWIQQEPGQSKSWELLTLSVAAVSGLALPTKEMIEQERSLHGWRLCLPFMVYGHLKGAISHDKTRTFGGLILRCETTPTTRLPETWRYVWDHRSTSDGKIKQQNLDMILFSKQLAHRILKINRCH